MPGGEGVTPRPDDSEEIEIIITVVNEWFGDLLAERQEDLEDCAGNAAEALYYAGLLRSGKPDEEEK